MFQRLLGAALAALLCLLVISTAAHADIIELRDGSFLPKGDATEGLEPGQFPSFQQLQESDSARAELAYDFVKIRGDTVSAAQVARIHASEPIENADWNNAETYAASQNFDEAAAAFESAAEELKTDCGRQVALSNAMLAHQAAGRDPNAMLRAADAYLAAFPKGYYVAPAHSLRARIFVSQGKASEAKAALDAVTKAPGMNARDYFEAELTRVAWFQMRAAGTDAKKLGATEKAYRNMAKLAGAKGRDADVQKLKALVGAGRCLVFMGKYDEARREFEAVTSDSNTKDKELLGAAYNGLGDAIYGKAKADGKADGNNEARKQAIFDALTDAALHYLRVTELYGDEFAPDEVLSATMNLARVFANQFVMGGQKDCKLGSRAYDYYRAAWQRLGRGEAKTQLGREALQFKKDLDAACK